MKEDQAFFEQIFEQAYFRFMTEEEDSSSVFEPKVLASVTKLG